MCGAGHTGLLLACKINRQSESRTDPPGGPSSTDPVHAKSQKCARAEKRPADGDYGAATARNWGGGFRWGQRLLSERHYLLGGASRRLGASLNHLPDWLTGEHGPGPGGPRVVRFIAMFGEF